MLRISLEWLSAIIHHYNEEKVIEMAYKVVDLFAGAGGLSLGFMQTGKFKIVAAAENNPGARKT